MPALIVPKSRVVLFPLSDEPARTNAPRTARGFVLDLVLDDLQRLPNLEPMAGGPPIIGIR